VNKAPHHHSGTLSVLRITAAKTVCSALLILFGASCRPVIAQEVQPETETIQGTVVNEVTGEGIGRALVYSPDNRFATLTDGQGHFEFIVPKPKQSPAEDNGEFVFRGIRTLMTRGRQTFYSFSARKPGFLEDPGNNVQAAPGTDSTIRLIPEAIIKGRVIASESEGAAGINIQLFARQVHDGMPRWVRSQAATANSNGEFRFADLMPDTYKIMTQELLDTSPVVRAPGSQIYGFPPICFPGVRDFASGAPIQLTAGQTFQADIPLARQPYFPVQIPVTNPADSNGLNVSVAAQSHPGPGYSLGYNPATQRIEGLLPRGSYLVEATAFGPTMASGSVNLAVAGKSSDAAPLALIPGLQIPVNVREEFTSNDWHGTTFFTEGGRSYTFQSGPRLYLNVSLMPADDFAERGSASLRPPLSRGDNTLVIDGIEPGLYRLRVNTSHGYVASATSGSVDLLREPLAIFAGSHTQIDVTMRDDVARVTVTLAGLHDSSPGSSERPSSRPVVLTPSAYIYWVPLPDSSGQFQESEISSEGQFSTEIAPGTYLVMAFARRQNSLPYRDAEAMSAYETQGQVVHLAAGQTQHVQLQLIQGSN
jgi:hypothetical protein